MNDQLKPPSDRFRKMAESIDHNAKQESPMPFAGAAVIVPPPGGGDPVEVMLLDHQANPAQFWATITTRIQMRLKELEEKQQLAPGFGRR